MRNNKPKLFTAEFITVCMLFLSLVVGAVTIAVYTDRLPLWVILVLGFWYPAGVLIRAIYTKLKGNGDSL
jgi:hypothetical protein